MSKPTKDEIEAEYYKAVESPDIFPGMTYSDGVQNALQWVLGDAEITPTCDD